MLVPGCSSPALAGLELNNFLFKEVDDDQVRAGVSMGYGIVVLLLLCCKVVHCVCVAKTDYNCFSSSMFYVLIRMASTERRLCVVT